VPSENRSLSASTAESKVRSLLGLPPQPNLTTAYPSPLPPVGFRYAVEPVMASQPDVLTPPEVGVAPGDEVDEVVYAVRRQQESTILPDVKTERVFEARSLPTSRHMPPQPEPADGAAHARDEAGSIRAAQPSATVGSKAQATSYHPPPEEDVTNLPATAPDVKDAARAGEASDRVKPPGIITERANLSVPGISKEVVDFPALSREAASTIAEQHPKQEEAPPEAQSTLHRTLALKESAHQLATEPVKAPSSPSGKPQLGNETPTRKPPPDAPKRFMTGALPEARNEARPKRAPPASPSQFSPRPMNAASSGDQRYPHVQPQRPVPDSRAAAATLEQLRRAVRQLTAKVAAQAQQDKKREAEPSPPPPIPHVMVVNKVAKAPGGAHAFWERRHLGRSRFRVMR
jgi:hypothetical protein